MTREEEKGIHKYITGLDTKMTWMRHITSSAGKLTHYRALFLNLSHDAFIIRHLIWIAMLLVRWSSLEPLHVD